MSNRFEHNDYIYYIDDDTKLPVVGKVIIPHKVVSLKLKRKLEQFLVHRIMDINLEKQVIVLDLQSGYLYTEYKTEVKLATPAIKMLYAK